MMGETNEPERLYEGTFMGQVLCYVCNRVRPVMARCECQAAVTRGPGYPAQLVAHEPVNVRVSDALMEDMRGEQAGLKVADARDVLIAQLQAQLAALEPAPPAPVSGKPLIPARTLSAPMAQRIGLITGWWS